MCGFFESKTNQHMQGSIKLDTRTKEKRKNGYPVILVLTGGAKRITGSLRMYFEKDQWDFKNEQPKKDRRAILYIKKKKRLLDELLFAALDDPTLGLVQIRKKVLNDDPVVQRSFTFYDFAEMLIDEMKMEVDEKGVVKTGNARTYEIAIKQMRKYIPSLQFEEIDYNLLNGFIKYRKGQGNKNTTIHNYLRTYRAIYNEAARRGLIQDQKPFKDVFGSIVVRRNRNVKKHISKQSIELLRGLKGLPGGQQFAVDMWLLQFYFGGQDFKDVYYLENSQINAGRVYFKRGKLGEAAFDFDLLIVEHAKQIIDHYNTGGRFVFPGRKDPTGYLNVIRRVQKNLVLIQKQLNLQVLPIGGNLGTKVSRHTFATIGRHLFIDPDLLRALMGHERNEIDTIYKDVYPVDVRDAAHLKIIS